MDKGQESMPIQLLLGVTILSFVLTIGFYSYRQVCSSQYDQRVKASLNKLARTIEQTYQGGVGTSPPPITMETSPPKACDVGLESIRIVKGTESSCKDRVGHDYCLVATAVTIDNKGRKSVGTQIYIDIPRGVSIDYDGNNKDIECGSKSLKDIYNSSSSGSSSNSLDDFCGWQRGTFTLKVTKSDSDTIKIEEL